MTKLIWQIKAAWLRQLARESHGMSRKHVNIVTNRLKDHVMKMEGQSDG